jgi:hypothetical protein|tara:strand:+ start:942 stop:1334 length:393 start_codon:yes stop_codon:yes gene_type:complete
MSDKGKHPEAQAKAARNSVEGAHLPLRHGGGQAHADNTGVSSRDMSRHVSKRKDNEEAAQRHVTGRTLRETRDDRIAEKVKKLSGRWGDENGQYGRKRQISKREQERSEIEGLLIQDKAKRTKSRNKKKQ